MKKFLIISILLLSVFSFACGTSSADEDGGGEQVANCVDNTNPQAPKVLDPSFCRNPNAGNNNGGGNGGVTVGDLILYSWIFGGHSYYPYGYTIPPTVINQYHMTTNNTTNKTYSTPDGGKIATDKSGKVTAKEAPNPAKVPAKIDPAKSVAPPKQSAPKTEPPKSSPPKTSPPKVSPPKTSAPRSTGTGKR